ncbi:MAG: ATP-binding protein [Chloroflexota bacterium]
MDRLWVRMSLAIGTLFFVVLGLLLVILVGASFMRWIPPIFDDGRPMLRDIWRELPEGFLGLLFVTGTIGMLSGVLVSRILSAPLTRLAAAARRIGEGDLSTRITMSGSREIKDLARSFNSMAADLEHAETLRNNLMADVSHELRTPLTVLEGNLRAALDRVYELDEEELAHLYGQTRHLIQLVNDLRELALAEAHKLPLDKQPTDLVELVRGTISIFEPLAEEQDVSLTYTGDADLPLPTIDAVRIRQVLHNLIGNSLRHTPVGGTIHITTHPMNKPTTSGIMLTIIDTGSGIDPAQLPYLFDRFYRGDKSRARESGGTGLGLAIVKAVVEEHGGRVTAKSGGHGQGTSVSVWLPI